MKEAKKSDSTVAMKRGTFSYSASCVILIICFMLGIGWQACASFDKCNAIRSLVEHSENVLIQIQQLLFALVDAETGQRGYLLTGKDEYLAPYKSGCRAVDMSLAHLRELTKDQVRQQQLIAACAPLITAKLQELQQTINLRQANGLAPALKFVQTGTGRQLMVQLRALAGEMDSEEHRLLRLREKETASVSERAKLLTVLMCLTAGLVALVLFLWLQRHVRELTMKSTVELSEQELACKVADLSAVTAELQRSNSELKRRAELIKIAPGGIFCLDENRLITFWSPGAMRMYGYKEEEVLGRSVIELLQSKYPEPLESINNKIMTLGFWEGEITHTRRDGVRLAVQSRMAALQIQQDEPKTIIEVNTDITVQKQATQYVRSLIEVALDPLVTISKEGRITDVNEATVHITGLAREKLIGTHFSDYFTDPDKARQGFEKSFTAGSVRDYPLTICHADGRLTDVLYNAAVYRDVSGNVLGTFAAARDISSQKEAAQLELLLHITSHDLKEPLRAIVSFAQLLGDRYAERLGLDGQDYLRRIVDGSKRMNKLLDDILLLSRVRCMDAPSDNVTCESVVDAALKELELKIKETGAKIQIVKPLPIVWLDRTWAGQAVINLLANSLKFTMPGVAPEIEIAPYITTKQAGIIVRDRGPGVKPEYAERIFQLFQRAVGREVPGTGAGLAIAQEVAHRHRGRCWVQPRSGGGSEFIITFGPPH